MSKLTGDQNRRASVHLRSLPYCWGKYQRLLWMFGGNFLKHWNLVFVITSTAFMPVYSVPRNLPQKQRHFLGAWKHLARQFQNENTEENICPKSNQISFFHSPPSLSCTKFHISKKTIAKSRMCVCGHSFMSGKNVITAACFFILKYRDQKLQSFIFFLSKNTKFKDIFKRKWYIGGLGQNRIWLFTVWFTCDHIDFR